MTSPKPAHETTPKWPPSNWNGGRDQIGIGGRLRWNPQGHRETGPARLATPTWLMLRAAAIIADLTAAVWTDRLAIGLGPAQAEEHVFCPSIGYPRDLARAERAG